MPNVDTSKKFDSVAIYRIRKLLSELANKTGRGTELVSLYLPPKKALHEAIAALREESGTASNIKSDVTRNHVQDALTKTIARLRLYKQTPENGLVIFCGAIPGPGGPGNETIDLFEVLPQKPVTTYLYRCIAPDSKVLLQNGMHKTIGEMKHFWKDASIKSTRNGCDEVAESRIVDYSVTAAGERAVYRLTSESGRSLVATEDHPFLTPDGWKPLSEIKPGDLVSVYPTDDLDPSTTEGITHPKQGSEVIVDETAIRNLEHSPANIELTVKRLEERGLLPLRSDNPKLPIIARILGHLFSDGSLTHNLEMRNQKPYSHFTIDVCLGDEESVVQVGADIGFLGYTVPQSFKTTHEMNFDGRSYTTTATHIKLRDTALCNLLRALGAPVGSKVKSAPRIPKWLFESPKVVQREFLAAYMGGDGEAPRIVKSNPVSALRLTFHRIESMREQGLGLARDISVLFEKFGIKINGISASEGYTRKDGLNTVEIELRFSLSEANLLGILHSIGYRYSKRKMQIGLLVGEYLRIKSHARTKAKTKLSTAIQMRVDGKNTLEIATDLDLPQNTARAWSRGRITSPLVRSYTVPDFDTWRSIAQHTPGQVLVWENVECIERVDGVQDVRDITVESEDHSFFANGFMVHNCDDHFHIEPLREMLREQNVIGVLAMDSTDCGLGIVSGDSWEVIDTMSSGVSGKTRKGGQSARRYERLREMELTDYFNRLADHATKSFLEQYQVKALIVSGPGPTKDEFVRDKYLDYRLQNIIIGTLDTGYAGREGVRETIEKSGKLLENVRVIEEKKLVQRFFREVNSDTGLAIYGVRDIIAALKKAAVDTIIINDDADTVFLKGSCSKCGNVVEKFVQRAQIVAEKQKMLTCAKCGSTEVEIVEKDIVDYLADQAIDSGANVEVISSKTEDGAMMKNFGGISAILRYRA